MADEFKTVSLDTMIGKRGPKKRDAFENQLGIELLGQAIQRARKERYLTQEYHCGKLSLPMPISHLGASKASPPREPLFPYPGWYNDAQYCREAYTSIFLSAA
jgi:hypothetical protein